MMQWLFPFLSDFVGQICEFFWQVSQIADQFFPGLGDVIFSVYEHLFC